MRDDLTLVFCLVAGFALFFGPAAEPPSLTQSYSAFEAAVDRGDMRRAARYGETALELARSNALFDTASLARLQLMVGEAQAQANNPSRAKALYGLALQGLDDGRHIREEADVKSRLEKLDRVIADRGLRGTVGAQAGAGS